MTNMTDIESTVVRIVAEHMDVAEVTRDSRFVEDLGIDSLDAVEIVIEIEDEFELIIPGADYLRWLTVGQAIDYLAWKAGR